VIKHSLKAHLRDSSEVDIILESIASEAPNSKKLVLQSTMNAFSIVDTSFLAAGRYFSKLLTPIIRRFP
jgi:hypothetical protein